MAGQQGNVRIKTQALEILKVIADKNILVIKGALPGAKGSYIIVEK
jgi:large subunit ribosomal protein L3